MPNEAAWRQAEANRAVDFTVADSAAFARGSLLQLTNPRTVVWSSGAYQQIAGIAARDKIANDGRTQVAVYQDGIFDMYLSGTILTGQKVTSAVTSTYPNYVQSLSGAITTYSGAQALSGAIIFGYALQDGVNGDQIQVKLTL